MSQPTILQQVEDTKQGNGSLRTVAVGARNIFQINKNGQYNSISLARNQLLYLGVKGRDLRLLNYSNTQPILSSILIRDQAIVLNLMYVQCVISSDTVWIPTADQELAFRFVQEVMGVIGQYKKQESVKQSTKNSKKLQVSFSIQQQSQIEQPFQLKVLDKCFEIVFQELETQVQQIESFTADNLNKISNKVSFYNMEILRRYKLKLVMLNTRVEGVKQAISQIIEDEKDNALFNTFASGYSNTEQKRALTPQGSIKNRAIFNTSKAQTQLESFYMQIDVLFKRLEDLQEYIDNEEVSVKLELDNHRNNIIQMDMVVTIINCAFASLVMVSALFGQNLPNDLSPKPEALKKVVIISIMVAILLCTIFFTWLRYQGLLKFTGSYVSTMKFDFNEDQEADAKKHYINKGRQETKNGKQENCLRIFQSLKI